MPGSFTADLHIHGTYSGATSDRMVFDTIAREAVKKGLDFVGSGDILHPKWLKKFQKTLEKESEGTYKHPKHKTRFVLTTEIEDKQRVHHLILIPSISKAKELRKKLKPHSKDLYIDGRPKINLNAPEITEKSIETNCQIGPSHAFTPWTSIYKEHDTIKQCYKNQTKNITFLELGLSADTYLADRLKELENLTFLSNSDAHSPWPNKLGREFNRYELSEPSSEELFDSIKNRENLSLNVGLDPNLGKYHRTACSKCYEKFSKSEAKILDWDCDECDGSIKKGVFDRINELANFEEPQHPDFRPDYLHTTPLSEIIALAWEQSNPRSKNIQKVWNSLVEEFGDEITVLVDVPISKIRKAADDRISFMIRAFRKGKLDIESGGGGKYGNLKLPSKVIKARKKEGQKTLTEFGKNNGDKTQQML